MLFPNCDSAARGLYIADIQLDSAAQGLYIADIQPDSVAQGLYIADIQPYAAAQGLYIADIQHICSICSVRCIWLDPAAERTCPGEGKKPIPGG